MKVRNAYIDNIKVFLISLVILHHWAITYGAPGGWYFYDSDGLGEIPFLLLTLFVATNQSFFMGMFFFISALFISSSLSRKGTKKFFGDRLIRLGMPTLIFAFIISPIVLFLLYRYNDGGEGTLLEFLTRSNWIGLGPMWFVVALLFFNLLFLLFAVIRKKIELRKISIPKNTPIIIFMILLSLVTFLVRINWEVGRSIPFLNFQLGHFPQYICLFTFGLLAGQNQWPEQLTFKKAKFWIYLSLLFIFILFPLTFILGGVEKTGPEPFMGGLTIQSLVYSFWEQFTGFALIIMIFGIFKKYVSKQNGILKRASRSAFAVYVFHTLVLVICGLLLAQFTLNPFVKFLISAPVLLLLNYSLAHTILQWNFASKIF